LEAALVVILAGLALLVSLVCLFILWRNAENSLFEASRRSWPPEED
jgi:hypothetical protein